MKKPTGRYLVLALALSVVLTAGAALAVDAPKWVAAVYVEAQKVVGLRWAPIAGATAYKVLRSTTKGADYKEIAAPTAPQHMDKDVEPGTTYYYVLQAVAGAEVSASSDEKSVAIPGEKKVVMNAPEWDKVTLQTSTEFGKTTFKAGLFWKAVPQALAYNVYRSLESGKGFELLSSTQEPKMVDDKIEAGKTYHYTVSALDASFMETPQSAEKSLKVEEEKKAVKKTVPSNKLVIKSTREIRRLTPGDSNALSSPLDAAIDSSGNLYIANANPPSVSVFGEDGEFKMKFGGRAEDQGALGQVYGMGIDSDDNIYVCDAVKIAVFDSKGVFKKHIVLELSKDEKLLEAAKVDLKGNQVLKPQPTDVAADKEGNLLVVDNMLARVVVLDGRTGAFISEFGMFGIGDGELKHPTYIAVNSKGEICINDNMNRRAVVWSPDYKFKLNIGEAKTFVGAFLGLSGAAADDKDDFIIVDPPMATLQVFSAADGAYMYHYGDEKKTVDEGSKGQRPVLTFNNPAGVAFNKGTKTLYVPLTQMNLVWVAEVIE